jgi:hypothetical protein
MNKGALIGIIVAVMIMFFAGGYFMLNRTSTKSPSLPVVTEMSNEQPRIVSTSLQELLKANTNQTCSFSDNETGNNGMMYFGSGKMRGDFTAQVEGKSVLSHMMSDGLTMYMWMDDGSTGFKTDLTKFEEAGTNSNVPNSIDLNKQIDYDCSSWSVDASMFIVPTDREFTDLTEMMEKSAEMMKGVTIAVEQNSESDKSSQCAACNSLSGEAKTQCLQVLSCN